VNPKLRNPDTDALFDAILALRNREECYAFFEDVLTVSELQAIVQRWAVARSLDQGQTYEDIARATGASSATISRVKRALMFGADGYRMVLDRLHNRRIEPDSTASSVSPSPD
jgi:TrpR-related protein YerC/YecD